METTVFVEGQLVNLDVNNTLGTGGEVTVIQGPHNLAYAIWHQDLEEKARKRLLEKIQYVRTLGLPECYLYPLNIITNRLGVAVGYTMKLLPHGTLSFAELSTKSIWQNYKIDQLIVTKLIKNLIVSLRFLWNKGGLVVDGNHNNFFFNPDTWEVYILDVLSFQYTLPNGKVLMATAIKPDICPPRQMQWLTNSTYTELFTLEDEKWWLLLLFLSSYLRAWPYFINLALDDLSTMLNCITNQQHIFNPTQEYYPLMVALPPKSLPDRTIFFCKKALDELKVTGSLEAEIDYVIENLVKCSKGKFIAFYPSERSQCPHCIKDRSLPDLSSVTSGIYAGAINYKAIFALVKGKHIVFVQHIPSNLHDDNLIIFIHHDEYGNLSSGRFNLETQKYSEVPLVDVNGLRVRVEPHFEYFSGLNYLAIGQIEPVGTDKILQGKIKLFDTEGKEVKEIYTGFFGKQVTFAISKQPYWVLGADIVKGKQQLSRINPELVSKGSNGKTWFATNGSDEVLVGFTNFTVQYQWFVYYKGIKTKLPISMKRDEHISKIKVVFNTPVDYVITFNSHTNAISRKRLVVIHENMVIIDILLPTMNIGRPALCFFKNLLLVPTDKGVIKYFLNDKNVASASIMPGTERVDVIDTLMILSGFIYVMSSDGTLFKLTK